MEGQIETSSVHHELKEANGEEGEYEILDMNEMYNQNMEFQKVEQNGNGELPQYFKTEYFNNYAQNL